MESSSSNKRYSGRFFSLQEIEQIRELIHTHPQINRQQLSYRVCEVFDWRKSDGSLKERGVAIFAKACFGHPSPSKRQKLNATANAFGAPDVLRTCRFATPS